jgi:tetratricopeptide (TPR) repeat protein
MRHARAAVAAAAVGVLVSGCAARVPVVTTPAYPDYPLPVVPAELEGTRAAAEHRDAWTFLQAGQLEAAEQRFAAILRDVPSFHPSVTGLGFVELARGDTGGAIARFEGAIARVSDYVPARLGRAEAFLSEDRLAEALDDFGAALAADPGLTAVRQRIAALEATALTRQVTAAREAAAAGRDAEARAAYERLIAASPESGFLYLELAEVERRVEGAASALARLDRAVVLDPDALDAWLLMADLYLATGDLDRAEQALLRADAIAPGTDVERRLDELDARRQAAALPPEYAAIETADAITRGQLAALLGVRFELLLAGLAGDGAAIITDARAHWAYRWMIDVAQAGIMPADVNYRFLPEQVVSRAELARILVRMLRGAGVEPVSPAGLPRFSDLDPGHLDYPAASEVVAAGLLPSLSRNAFRPGLPVTGDEAMAALSRLGRATGTGR